MSIVYAIVYAMFYGMETDEFTETSYLIFFELPSDEAKTTVKCLYTVKQPAKDSATKLKKLF